MQELSKEILIKSLGFNLFYPRDLSEFKNEIIKFSYDLNDLNDAFITSDFDELGYARRYVKKHLFYYSKNLSEDELIKASIYGADGIVLDKIANNDLLNLAKNCGFSLGFLAKNNIDLFKATIKQFDIFIANDKLLKNVPNTKYKGILNATPKSTLA
ncbi:MULTISPECIES: hypothetical protein [unclassified Campylobacter]|uniref:hypothetical protein n=1 Tax=unclassified Campylobacter TaxID=2593542 RepID=UPI001BD97B58|nr:MULTISPECIES: hypothetical protein [unclassified Campylobacter]MBZ7975888.1 hypothetical protein [Campylobacter sp. RM12637]MBZ7981110.1 hypothetical protein [Campylobacter sp. RM12640]MBZ7989283.1 hypothetical protein [Campylobacter sp. RM12635]MBZ7990462.1 hypothetical protein [Campylobacter sp. RM9331]MBZ7992179.1 hypothetical protein [Campylobacter sp. RM9333]MBZ8005049.1 hypothetical protein [Campylobacter sp. RM9332]